MAKITESIESRKYVRRKSFVLNFTVFEEPDPAAAVALAINTAAGITIPDNLNMRDPVATPVPNSNFDVWRIEIPYNDSINDYNIGTLYTRNDVRFNYANAGGTRRVTESISTISVGDNFGKLIGYDSQNRKVNGIDIPSPEIRFSITKMFTWNDFTDPSYQQAFVALIGKQNNAEFYGFPAYSVRYDGISSAYADRKNGYFTVTHDFAVAMQEVLTMQYYPAGSTEPVSGTATKPGWSVLEVHYKEKKGVNNSLPVVTGISIHQVLPAGDFADLGIGTSW